MKAKKYPKRGKGPQTKYGQRIVFCISKETYSDLQLAAKQTGFTISEINRFLLEKWLRAKGVKKVRNTHEDQMQKMRNRLGLA